MSNFLFWQKNNPGKGALNPLGSSKTHKTKIHSTRILPKPEIHLTCILPEPVYTLPVFNPPPKLTGLVSTHGIHVDESKIKAIQEWPVRTSIQQVRSFHGLASFYRRFVKNFSSFIAPMIAVIKGRTFEWNEAA